MVPLSHKKGFALIDQSVILMNQVIMINLHGILILYLSHHPVQYQLIQI